MTTHIIETVLFTLKPDTSLKAFHQAIEQSNTFVTACQGFIARRLSVNEAGQWIEHIEWKSIEDAQAAALRIGDDENTQAFVGAIDGPSVQLFHTNLHASVDKTANT